MRRLTQWVAMLFGLWIGSILAQEPFDIKAAYWAGCTLFLVWLADRRGRE